MIWFLVAVVALATYFDLKSRKIPNWISYGTICISLFYFDRLYVIFVFIGILVALAFGKYIGAGDIKLSVAMAIWSHILNLSQYWIYFALLIAGLWALFNRRERVPFAPFIAAGLLLANVARGYGFI